MKAYRAQMSSRLITQFFKTGVQTDFGERVVVLKGLPEEATLFMCRIKTPGILDMLFLTEEPGEIPEAVDLWKYAKDATPLLRTETQ